MEKIFSMIMATDKNFGVALKGVFVYMMGALITIVIMKILMPL